MKIEFYPEKKLKKEILEICRKYLNLKKYKIFLFGSRVKRTNFPRADIDIGIEGREPLSPEIKFKIEEELERIPIFYKFELVDFFQVSKIFQKKAKKFIEYVN